MDWGAFAVRAAELTEQAGPIGTSNVSVAIQRFPFNPLSSPKKEAVT
jgi:hypothetical protein